MLNIHKNLQKTTDIPLHLWYDSSYRHTGIDRLGGIVVGRTAETDGNVAEPD